VNFQGGFFLKTVFRYYRDRFIHDHFNLKFPVEWGMENAGPFFRVIWYKACLKAVFSLSRVSDGLFKK